MSIFASALRAVYKLSGAKKAFGLPEDEIRRVIDKQNRSRGVFTPTDHKAHYETVTVNGFPCLIVRERSTPSERAILYFFGGGMVIGPDKGDLPVMRKLMRDTGCDVWFPFYPLCTEHCITETYDMVYECYRRMIALYGGGNVGTCGFSSGGAQQRAARAAAAAAAHCGGLARRGAVERRGEGADAGAERQRRRHRLRLYGDGREIHAPRAGKRAGLYDLRLARRFYQKMRGMSYQEVVQTHGQISFPEVLRKEKAL